MNVDKLFHFFSRRCASLINHRVCLVEGQEYCGCSIIIFASLKVKYTHIVHYSCGKKQLVQVKSYTHQNWEPFIYKKENILYFLYFLHSAVRVLPWSQGCCCADSLNTIWRHHNLYLVIQTIPLQCRTYGLHQNHLLIDSIWKGQPMRWKRCCNAGPCWCEFLGCLIFYFFEQKEMV